MELQWVCAWESADGWGWVLAEVSEWAAAWLLA